jgi:hypothetical protein
MIMKQTVIPRSRSMAGYLVMAVWVMAFGV